MNDRLRRLAELKAEMADLTARMEQDALQALNEALSLLHGVASDEFPGRQNVRNDAKRLLLILDRETPAFVQIVEKGQ